MFPYIDVPHLIISTHQLVYIWLFLLFGWYELGPKGMCKGNYIRRKESHNRRKYLLGFIRHKRGTDTGDQTQGCVFVVVVTLLRCRREGLSEFGAGT